MKAYSRFLLVCSVLLFLAACHVIPFGNYSMPSFSNNQDSPEYLLNQANQQSRQEVANQYRLIAADKYLQANNLAQAQQTLDSLQPELNNTQQMIATMLRANIAFNKRDTATALNLLNSNTFSRLDEQDADLQVRIRLLKANVLETDGKALQALRERSYISSFLSGQAAQDNHNHIWRLAMSIPLDILNTSADGGETGGWLQLAKAVKSASTLAEQKDNINQWLAANPNHPAAINPPAELGAMQNLTSQAYGKIAILLPQKQKYAQAIYNGFIAAYYQSENKDSITIKTYEITEFPSMDAFYQQAQQDGIQLVIGPIDKNLVNELSRKPSLAIPTLALNYADTNIEPPQLFQFGLLPEDEAKEVAMRAFSDGKRHAVAVVPQGEWGGKVLAAFRAQWEAQGGILEGIQYIDRPVDLDSQLTALISKLPGNGIKSTALDDNMLFMVAEPFIARQIRALLTYHDGENLPVYATSHIYAGVANPSQDSDLNGVLFTETPWLLNNSDPVQQSIITQWPQAKTSFARLYALGVDAWRLTPRLLELKALPNSRVYGLSGELTIDHRQRVVRKLPWATFNRGLIRPAPSTGL